MKRRRAKYGKRTWLHDCATFVRRTRHWLCVPLIAALAGSCTQDYLLEDPAADGPQVPGTVLLSVSVPGLAPAPQTQAMSPQDERMIHPDYLHLLLFRQEGEEGWVFDRRFRPEDIEQVSTPTAVGASTVVQFRFRLEPGEAADGTTYKAMLLANAGKTRSSGEDLLEPIVGALTDGMPIAEVRQKLVMRGSDTGIEDHEAGSSLPMWGETDVAFSASHTSAGTVQMLRAAARIDIGLDIDKSSGGSYDLNDMTAKGISDFTITGVDIFNYSTHFCLAPDPANLSPEGRSVTAPTVPETVDDSEGAGSMDAKSMTMTKGSGVSMITRELYFPETKKGYHWASTGPAPFFIIVRGQYKGGPDTYYKVELYDRTGGGTSGGAAANEQDEVKPTDENRYDLLRNHVYVVNILRVRGPGYETLERAKQSDPINIEVSVDAVDELASMTEVVTDGQYRLGLSDTELPLYVRDNHKGTVEVLTDYAAAADPGWVIETDSMSTEVKELLNDGRLAFELNGTSVAAAELRGRAGTTDHLTVYCQPARKGVTSDLPHEVEIPIRAGRMNATLKVIPAPFIDKPYRNMQSEQRFLNSREHALHFWFGNSYFQQLRVRVAYKLVNTICTAEGIADQDVQYVNEGKEEGTVITAENPHLLLNIPINNAVNQHRQVVVEYYDEEDGVWKADRSPTIFQEGIPLLQTSLVNDDGYFVRYDVLDPSVWNENGVYTRNEIGLLRSYRRNTEDYQPWVPVSPRQNPNLALMTWIDLRDAAQAIEAGIENGTVKNTVPTTYHTDLVGKSGKRQLESDVTMEIKRADGSVLEKHTITCFSENYSTTTVDNNDYKMSEVFDKRESDADATLLQLYKSPWPGNITSFTLRLYLSEYDSEKYPIDGSWGGNVLLQTDVTDVNKAGVELSDDNVSFSPCKDGDPVVIFNRVGELTVSGYGPVAAVRSSGLFGASLYANASEGLTNDTKGWPFSGKSPDRGGINDPVLPESPATSAKKD